MRRVIISAAGVIFISGILFLLRCNRQPSQLTRLRILSENAVGDFAEIAKDVDGKTWLIVRNNHETKVPYSNEHFSFIVSARHAPPSVVATCERCGITSFPIFCRFGDNGPDIIWDVNTGEILYR